MIVRDFMTSDPVTASPDTLIRSALVTMDRHGIRHLPVMADEHLVGVISDRDLIGQIGWSHFSGIDPVGPTETRIDELMQKEVVTVHPSDPLMAAAVEISAQRIGCLPVLEDGRLVGIVSETDLLRLVSELEGVPEGADQAIDSICAGSAVTADPMATVKQLDELMTAKGIRHVPIASGGAIVGMVSDRDMRRAGWHGMQEHTRADEIMSKDVVLVSAESTIQQAALVMSDRRISALVVESEGGGVGIATSTDLLEFALAAFQ